MDICPFSSASAGSPISDRRNGAESSSKSQQEITNGTRVSSIKTSTLGTDSPIFTTLHLSMAMVNNHRCAQRASIACCNTYQVTYQVRPHLLLGILQSWWGHWARRTGWSMKKPIRFFINLLSPFLKVLIVPKSMTLCGKSFHLSITRWEKKDRRKSRWHRGLSIFAVWPRVFVTVLIVKKWPNGVDDHPL